MKQRMVVKRAVSISPDANRFVTMIAGGGRHYSATLSAIIEIFAASTTEAHVQLAERFSGVEIDAIRATVADIPLTTVNVATLATIIAKLTDDTELATRIVGLTIPARAAFFI